MPIKMQKANILLLTSDFPPALGGVAQVMYNIKASLKDNDLRVLTSSGFERGQGGSNSKIEEGIFRKNFDIQLPKWRLPFELVKVFCFCLKIFLKNPFANIMVGEVFPLGLIGLIFKWLWGVRFITFSHGSDSLFSGMPRRDWLVGIIFRNADFVVGFSEYTCGNIAKWAVKPERIKKVSLGIDTQLFRPGIDISGLKQELNLSGKRVLLTINRLIERKGIDTVINCLRDLTREITDVLYLVIGDGPDVKRLKGLVSELGLEKYVIFGGAVQNYRLPVYYNACDIFINLARPINKKGWNETEGLGIVNLEAASCAKPVISSATGGMYETLEHDQSGLFINPQEPAQLKEAVLHLLGNRDYAKELSDNARKRIVELFSQERMQQDLSDLFKY